LDILFVKTEAKPSATEIPWVVNGKGEAHFGAVFYSFPEALGLFTGTGD